MLLSTRGQADGSGATFFEVAVEAGGSILHFRQLRSTVMSTKFSLIVACRMITQPRPCDTATAWSRSSNTGACPDLLRPDRDHECPIRSRPLAIQVLMSKPMSIECMRYTTSQSK